MRPSPRTLGPVVEKRGLTVSFWAWAEEMPTRVMMPKKARAKKVDLLRWDIIFFIEMMLGLDYFIMDVSVKL